MQALARSPDKRTADQHTVVSDFLRVFTSTSVLAPVHMSAFAERVTVQQLGRNVPGSLLLLLLYRATVLRACDSYGSLSAQVLFFSCVIVCSCV
jgi:hypothetical protein